MKSGDIFENKYRIERKLGEGGFAEVYLGRHLEIDYAVAIKILKASKAEERFIREGRILANLTAPQTVRILDFGRTSQNRPYIVSEYIEGSPLHVLLRQGAVPWERALEIAEQVLSSLAEAHRVGIVHRDMKPENVMELPDGSIKVLDFGIASLGTRSHVTATGLTLGTPVYMAPEQLLGASNATPGSDLFSVGLLVYELLTTERANSGTTFDEIVSISLGPSVFELPADLDVPGPVRQWVNRLCKKDPKQRPEDADAAISELKIARQKVEETPERAGTRVVAIAALAAVVLVGTGGWIALSLRQSDPQPASFHPPPEYRSKPTQAVETESSGPVVSPATGAFERGLEAFSEERWFEAVEAFAELERYPDSEEYARLRDGNYVSRAVKPIVDLPRGPERKRQAQRLLELYPDPNASEHMRDQLKLIVAARADTPDPITEPAAEKTTRRTEPVDEPDKPAITVERLDEGWSGDATAKTTSADDTYTKALSSFVAGDDRAAIQHATVAVRDEGCRGKCYRILGMSNYRLGNRDEACRWFAKTKAKGPPDLDCR